VEFDEALQLLSALEKEQVRYVLVGSMALAAQGLVRATRDIDLFVAADEENVTRLRCALKTVFQDDTSIDEITAEDLGGDYPAIQYTPPHGQYSVDILARLGERYTYQDIESEVLDIEGVRVFVATPRMLYHMKRNTVRPQDRIDAEALRQRFGIEEED
jgi:ABC-type molybdate transport system substrate-binding protein